MEVTGGRNFVGYINPETAKKRSKHQRAHGCRKVSPNVLGNLRGFRAKRFRVGVAVPGQNYLGQGNSAMGV